MTIATSEIKEVWNCAVTTTIQYCNAAIHAVPKQPNIRLRKLGERKLREFKKVKRRKKEEGEKGVGIR